MSSEPERLVTGVDQGTVANTMVTFIHRGLTSYDSNGKVVDALAESIKQVDPKTYEFTLRPDLTFQDDSPLTAQNVKDSLEYYADEDNGATSYVGLKDIESVEVVDKNKGVIRLSAPNSALLEYLAVPTAAVVPDASLNPDADNVIGAGPFKLKEHNKGVNLVLDRFKGYYGKPVVKSIDVSFYADGDARTNALLSGDVDIIDYVQWPDFKRVSAADGVTLDGQNGPVQFVQFNVTEGPFANPKVRQAVAHAINRKNSISAAFEGNGESLAGVYIPKTDAAYDAKTAKLWDFDVEKAKQLLADAGFPNGFKATMLTTSQYKFLEDTALSVQADLKKIGIDVKLDSPDWSTRVSKGNSGDYDLAVAGGSGIVPDPTYIKGFVSGPNSFLRSYGYRNDSLDAKLDEGLRSTDDASKKAAYDEAAKIIQADVPFASINVRNQAFAYHSNVKGFKTLPGFLSFYSGYSFADISMKSN